MPFADPIGSTPYAALLEQAQAWRARWGSANPLRHHPRLQAHTGLVARLAGRRVSMRTPRYLKPDADSGQQEPI